ncbi:MAG: PTS sugar transporter subunit IIA [Planctomycetes bacterium]|nr:PTS sugar transporter subunit IIA [Planctomycetota bacterium]
MLLRPLIARSTVLVDPPVGNKWDLIAALAALVHGARDDWGLGVEEMRARVMAREQQITTGLERGIALPHGLLPSGAPSCVGMALLPRGLDFASLDGGPAHFVLLMVFPDDEMGRRLHLELLARSVRLLSDPGLRQALLGAPDAGVALDVVAAAERAFFP